MDDGELADEQLKLAPWTDPSVRGRADLAAAACDAESAYSRDNGEVFLLANRLKARFERDPALQRILIRCDGEPVAVAVREKCVTDSGTAGASAGDLGSAERAGLPGRSTRYALLRFECGRAGCPESAYRLYYDDRSLPVCGAAGHGPMESVEVVR
ncbi:hypothetical protein [Actinomadura bangladeshensis]|uniref:Uncharacterized protein n=1 Tax=Actinomadura bangladeshensis TaxID=453573 RepID=A0A4R4NKG3_9ACTN|nr:hypothetical protein [Actinomadura bangladeshensis]TDC09878.1 hypothetical protein E1284_28825 [Actinomadura bangladeshensis]